MFSKTSWWNNNQKKDIHICSLLAGDENLIKIDIIIMETISEEEEIEGKFIQSNWFAWGIRQKLRRYTHNSFQLHSFECKVENWFTISLLLHIQNVV